MTDLDQRMHEYAHRWQSAQPPVAVDLPVTRLPRRAWIPAALTAVVVLAMATGVAIGDLLDSPEPRPVIAPPVPAVPWLDEAAMPGTGLVEPEIPPGTPACDDLAIQATRHVLSSTLFEFRLRIRNTSERACFVDDPEAMSFVNGNGKELAGAHVVGPFGRGPARRFLVPPSHELRSMLRWENYCGPKPDRVDLRLHIGDAVVKAEALSLDTPDCPAAANFTEITGPRFRGPATARGTTVYADLVASIAAPATVRAGDALHYRVTLTNPTSNPLPLDPCPAYSHGWKGDGGHANFPTYRLNCAPQTIAAGQSVTFAMELAIPETATGDGALSWLLDPEAWNAPQVTVTTAVT